LERAAATQAKYYNKHRRDISYEAGDKVFVLARFLPKRDVTKFDNRRERPFVIVRKNNNNSYQVRVPVGYNDTAVVGPSVDKLASYRPSKKWQLDPGRVRRSSNARVLEVLGHRRREGRATLYKVRYAAHHPGFDQFVPRRDVPADLLQTYRLNPREV
jgi:hypothetical protein